MKPRLNKSVTLMELIIAIVLMSLMVLSFTSIDLYSRYHVFTSDRRARVQNEAAFVLEHMSRQIARTIGNERITNANSVVNVNPIGADLNSIRVFTDTNGNGQRDGGDSWIAYRRGNVAPQLYQIRYCNQCNNVNCAACPSGWEILSRRIVAFVPNKHIDSSNFLTDNFVEIELSSCWNPSSTTWNCGTGDNPSATMRIRIKMPYVSTN